MKNTNTNTENNSIQKNQFLETLAANAKPLKVEITLTEDCLGMMPTSQTIYRDYIASKAPDAVTMEEEIENSGIEGVESKGTTVFPRNEQGQPFFWDYQIRGMIKESISMLKRMPGTKCSSMTAHKKIVDGMIFVKGLDGSRKIPIDMSGNFGNCQRSLRTDGPTGSRTALASSETIPAGSKIRLQFIILPGKGKQNEDVVRECLDYGILHGLGQWRNSGAGTFTWKEID